MSENFDGNVYKSAAATRSDESAGRPQSTWSPGMQLLVGAATALGLLGMTQLSRRRRSSYGDEHPVTGSRFEGNFD